MGELRREPQPNNPVSPPLLVWETRTLSNRVRSRLGYYLATKRMGEPFYMWCIQSPHQELFDVYCGSEFILTVRWNDLIQWGMKAVRNGSRWELCDAGR